MTENELYALAAREGLPRTAVNVITNDGEVTAATVTIGESKYALDDGQMNIQLSVSFTPVGGWGGFIAISGQPPFYDFGGPGDGSFLEQLESFEIACREAREYETRLINGLGGDNALAEHPTEAIFSVAYGFVESLDAWYADHAA